MPDPLTTNLQLAQPTRGSDAGTWDVPVNGNSGILDDAFGSVASIALSSTGVTLTIAQAQKAVLRFSGTITANIAVLLPATPSIFKFWTVENNTTGNFYVTLGNYAGGNVVGLPPYEPVQVYSDGTDMKFLNLGRVGSYVDLATTAVPSWITNSTVPPYLNCDGSTFSSATYPALYALLGTTTLPDSRGRFRATLNQGTGRIVSPGLDANTLLAGGGSQLITQANLPSVNFSTAGIVSVTINNDATWQGFNGSPGAGNAVAQLASSAPNANAGTSFWGIAPTGSVNLSGGYAASGGSASKYAPPSYAGGLTLIRAA